MNKHDVNRTEPRATPARLSTTNIDQHRLEYRRLLKRYQELAWCTSAVDQRERTALQQPLMELYRVLHPERLTVHLDDDFDTLMRARRRP
jgi:hypothetical protein